ncbi:MAG: alanine--tRNA ligase, partial [Dehalococcoidia bacterium]|nr:alanine--tRNA ligase [Dehalococcoidia bacterium]
GRGYVLRRLLRRTALFGKRLGMETFLAQTAQAAIEHMSHVYPELGQRRDLILKVVELEEARFAETLNTGLALLDEIMAGESVKLKGKISGEDVFKLYDTYGFPVELTREITTRAGFALDQEGFEREMERQRERARAAHKFDIPKEARAEVGHLEKTLFVAYHHLKYKSAIVDILVDSQSAQTALEGQEVSLILEATPFYGEMGGQVGDTGVIKNPSGQFTVTNTVRLGANIIAHQGKVASGKFSIGDEVEAEVDRERRLDIARNHTSTHLLQFALRQVLGQHVQQKGSMVGPAEFRFDFSHLTALTPAEIQQVQHIVNAKIRENLIVSADQMPHKKAISDGAIALFDEKYGDIVRVIKVGDPAISAELCGGTHVSATGQIGFFQIVTESSIGAGLRRIVAVTGRGAEALVAHNQTCLIKIAELLGSSPHGAHEKVAALLQELEEERKRGLNIERELARKTADSLLSQVETVNGVKVLAAKVPNSRLESLRDMTDILKERIQSGIIVLGTVYEDKPAFVAAVTSDLTAKGYNAGNIVREVAKVTGGGGGGKPGLAQAGGKDKSRLDEALQVVKKLVNKLT